MQESMRLPNDTQRILILGRTGSGKTIAAKWHLSHRRYDQMPWVIYDFKTDPSLASIPFSKEIAIDEIPTGPGVFVVRPAPGQEKEVELQMWQIWAKGKMGVYIDEGYMLGNRNKAFRALLTQGRSKQIPMIVLTQRPLWLDRFSISEADFYQVFQLNDAEDRKTIGRFIPIGKHHLDRKLDKYHSWYYNVGDDDLRILAPVGSGVPNIDEIIDATFARRLGELQKKARAV